MTSKIANFLTKRRDKKALSEHVNFCSLVNKHNLEHLTEDKLNTFIMDSFQEPVRLDFCFAVLREVSKRTLSIYHHDSQIMAAKAMYDGFFCEMDTGEGKTFVIALVAAMKALTGSSVYIPTDNTYLAKRDCKLLGLFYEALHIKTSYILETDNKESRQIAYQSKIIYSTMTEFGYDYLRDGLAKNNSELAQKTQDVMLIDEVDSVLVDNASLPLVISSSLPVNAPLHDLLRRICIEQDVTCLNDDEIKDIKNMDDEITYINTSTKNIHLGSMAMDALEVALVTAQAISAGKELYLPENLYAIQSFESHFKAEYCYRNNIDYTVQNGSIFILDERTNRINRSSRWGLGLHQAVEKKENVELKDERVPTFSISVQNYVKLFNFISGTSGTVSEDSSELEHTYNKGFVRVPSNKECIRKDHKDAFYLDRQSKINHVARIIEEKYIKEQPVLINTESTFDLLAIGKILKEKQVPFALLSSDNIAEEPKIIALAATPKRVTITNGMVGRGTDIVLGGNIAILLEEFKDDTEKYSNIKKNYQEVFSRVHDEVINNGGLCVIGCGRSMLRKSDRQLIGRSGRQGDVGESMFISSLEDDLFSMYNGTKVKNFFKSIGVNEGEVLSHNFINSSIIKAQNKYNGELFKSRSHSAKMGGLTEEQRVIIYKLRKDFLNKDSSSLQGLISEVTKDVREALNDDNHQKLIDAFDLNFLTYSHHISDLSKSVFLQSVSNKDPFLEFKPKSFKIFEDFIYSLKLSCEDVMTITK
jgi:preprotein translocase subunit SecA